MFDNINRLLSRISKLLSQTDTAIEKDLQDVFADKDPAGGESLRLNTAGMHSLIDRYVRKVQPGKRACKIRYVVEPGKGIEAIVTLRPINERE